MGVDREAQAVEHYPGFVREPLGNNLLFLTAGDESFGRIAKANGHPDNAMRAIVLVQERDGV